MYAGVERHVLFMTTLTGAALENELCTATEMLVHLWPKKFQHKTDAVSFPVLGLTLVDLSCPQVARLSCFGKVLSSLSASVRTAASRAIGIYVFG